MMMKPLVVVLLLLGALASETRAQDCNPFFNFILKFCLSAGVEVDNSHSTLASLSLPPTHAPIPQVSVCPPATPHAPTPPPSSPPAPAHPPSTPQPPASPPSTPRPPPPPPSTPRPPPPPPSTPQPPASPPSTPRPPPPPPSIPLAPPPRPSSICCQQMRNMVAANPTTACQCLRGPIPGGLISINVVLNVIHSCGINLGGGLCVNL